MSKLVVISYTDAKKAEQVIQELVAMQKEQIISLEDAAYILSLIHISEPTRPY